MPRSARHYIEGGFFHIHTRGIDKRTLFAKPADYQFFIDLIKEHLPAYNLVIHHYCLMLNHVHLLIQVKDPKAPALFMKKILQCYAGYFRRIYASTGFIFQNRYKSHWIDNHAYLLRCGRYIERNPIRHGLTTDLYSYRWNSFSCYATGKPDGIITFDPMFLRLAQDQNLCRQEYREYVLKDSPYDDIVDDVMFGD